jgi:hypothetical protein
MSRIMKKLEINPDFDIDEKDGNWDEKLGVAMHLKITENAYLAQNEINDFIGNIFGMTGEQFGKLPIKESLEKIKQLKELDGISDFFKYVGRLTK